MGSFPSPKELSPTPGGSSLSKSAVALDPGVPGTMKSEAVHPTHCWAQEERTNGGQGSLGKSVELRQWRLARGHLVQTLPVHSVSSALLGQVALWPPSLKLFRSPQQVAQIA